MRALVIALAALGCSSRVNSEYCQKHATDHEYCPWLDASGTPDTPGLCLGPGSFALCVPPPTDPVTLPADLDSDLSPLCLATQPAVWKAAGQPDACVIVGTMITADMVRAHGGRPLVLVASDTIKVTGLDVSSTKMGTSPGAGYDPSACGMFGQIPGSNSQGGGGGAGGTFYGNSGGAGGGGNSGNIPGGLPAPMLTAMPTILRGGCPGEGGGGGGAGISGGGASGIGGGAVYLVAANQLDLSNATINASGAGGGNGTVSNAGGGGGGSGGTIILHAGTIGASGAKLVANGGGGGGFGSLATPGADPDPTMPATPAMGGSIGGGSGFASAANAVNGTTGSGGNGGGGGGGGGGYIQTNHVLGTTTVSPNPTTI